MLGGGQFVAYNKVLPGTYINYVSARLIGVSISERGIIAFPMETSWGKDGVTMVDTNTFMTEARKLFGVSYDSDEMKDIREILKFARIIYVYRLNGNDQALTDGAAKATGTFATAKYAGTFGNNITISVTSSVDDEGQFKVTTYTEGVKRQEQTVASAADLVDNDYVTFKKDATLEDKLETLTGGKNKVVTGEDWTNAMAAFEEYNFNAIGFKTTDKKVISIAKDWTKRMRDRIGAKYHAIVCADKCDYEGIIQVDDVNAVPWVTGADGSIAINKSLTNTKYDGEYELKSDYTQVELENLIGEGKFVFHTDGDDVYVLRDIDSLTTFTIDKNQDFSLNQVMRVLDEDALQTAAIFNKTFLGHTQNDEDGRASLKGMLMKLGDTMQNLRAIENFDGKTDITVKRGELKTDVIVDKAIQPVVAMEKLYVTVYVS